MPVKQIKNSTLLCKIQTVPTTFIEMPVKIFVTS